MRVLIVTAGSRGDVAPFTGLGRRLEQAGHRVSIAAHERFAELVRVSGLEYRLLPGDPVELARARMAAPSPGAGHDVFSAFLDQLADGLTSAVAAGTEVVLTAFGPAPLSRTIAAAFGIPSAGTYLVPSVPTAAFPLPGAPARGETSAAANLAAGRDQLARAAGLYGEVVQRLRTRLGLPMAELTEAVDPPAGWPICHGFSPTVVPRPDDWPAHVRVSGYWWPQASAWRPSDELIEFLQVGDAPVFVGFGSMTPSDAHELARVVTAAIDMAGVRAVVQTGWSGLAPVGEDIFVVDDVPHDWLFPRMAAVVHHAGAGTTAAGLRAGVPTVAVPFLLDQPFWAARLHALGVAPPPLPQHDLTAEDLAAAIRRCLDEPRYRSRAAELAVRVNAEDGATGVLEMLDGLPG